MVTDGISLLLRSVLVPLAKKEKSESRLEVRKKGGLNARPRTES